MQSRFLRNRIRVEFGVKLIMVEWSPQELPFGIDQKTGKWTGEYERRNAPGVGFLHQDNKVNLIANWLLAMFDATAKPVYRERAEKWFHVMKSRTKLKHDGTYVIWNYWEPSGAWDYKSDGLPKLWIGVHRNAVYYDIDVEGIVAAYKHGSVFNKDDINRLIATAIAEKRYWTALVPFDDTIQKQFEDTLDPSTWGGLALKSALVLGNSVAKNTVIGPSRPSRP